MLGIYALSSYAFGCYINHMTRYLYFCLLLYRPIFTQLCSGQLDDFRSKTTESSFVSHRPSALANSLLYSSVAVKCAAECTNAAINLIALIFDTYQSQVADAWWYNGFCKYLPLLDTEWFSRYGKGDKILICELYNHRCIYCWIGCDDVSLLSANYVRS
jgi:hypothetical protein